MTASGDGERVGREAIGQPANVTDASELLEPDADFASEHSSVTVADDLRPEGVKEPESPDGTGGPGGMDV